MQRKGLISARDAANLTQHGLAKLLGTTQHTVSRWERGTQRISAYFREKLQEKLNYRDEHLPDLDGQEEAQEPDDTHEETINLQPCQDVDTQSTMDSSVSHSDIPESEKETDLNKDRRAITRTIVVGTGIALVSGSTRIITSPLVETDEYLDVAKTSIPTWWELLYQGSYNKLESKLNKHVPVLKRIATTISPFQKEAASLAVEAKIMQVLLANHNLDFSQRESHCLEAIQMAELSGDSNLLATAQLWYGDTFTYCYRKPQTAIKLLNDALSNVDGNALIATQIYSDLSIAHAQNHDETNALTSINLAYSTMLELPLLSPLHRFGSAELNQKEGKTYLYLAEYLPAEYAQKAYDAFNQSTSKQASSKGFLIQALTRKADAARALGDMNRFVESLEQALPLIVSKRRIVNAQDVMDRVPDEWKSEDAVQELQKDLNHALVVVS